MLLEVNSGSFLPAALRNWDHAMFYRLNGEWTNGFLDTVVPYLREPMVWVPFYIFLALFTLINFRTKGGIWILFLMAAAGFSDYTNSSIIKDIFQRLRPCRDPELIEHVRLLVNSCPSSFSFVSSHAVNHFTIATFIFMTFRNSVSKKWAFVFVWAALICYAQVYVGVHSPVDVIGGAVVGFIFGSIFSTLFNRFFALPELHNSEL